MCICVIHIKIKKLNMYIFKVLRNYFDEFLSATLENNYSNRNQNFRCK